MDKSAQFTQDDMLRIGQSFCAMAESLSAAVTAAGAISTALVRCNVLTVQEQWVQTWGETVNKKTAGRMLGVSASQITNLINAGTLATSPDGRVLVRQAAEWANAKDQSKGSRYKPVTRVDSAPRFVP